MRVLISREGIISLLVSLLRLDDPGLIEMCAKALVNLTSASPTAKALVIKVRSHRLSGSLLLSLSLFFLCLSCVCACVQNVVIRRCLVQLSLEIRCLLLTRDHPNACFSM